MSDFDPFTGARTTDQKIDRNDPRLGTPPDKMGMASIPLLTADRRTTVLMMLFPPEELRDQPLHVIEAVIARQAQGLLKSVALEIYKSFTSDPVDASGAQNVITALQAHVEATAKRGRR